MKSTVYQQEYNKKYFCQTENKEKARKKAKEWYEKNKEKAKKRINDAYHESKVLKGRPKGKNHHAWQGEKAGYFAKHTWIEREFGKSMKCSACGCEDKKKYHWANISDTYKRDITDWIRLCVSCHRILDYLKGVNSIGSNKMKQTTIDKAPDILKHLAKNK